VTVALTLAALLAGCAVGPSSGPAVEPAGEARVAVTALSSAPDTAGQRTWWLFLDDRNVSVQAGNLDEALRLAGLPADSSNALLSGADEEKGTATVGIGGGGR